MPNSRSPRRFIGAAIEVPPNGAAVMAFDLRVTNPEQGS